MNCIVFIGSNKSGSSYEAMSAAKSMDYFTVLLTDEYTHLEKREDFSSVDYMEFCPLDDLDSIRRSIELLGERALEIRAIVSFMERNCYTASLVAKEFSLNYFTLEAIRIMLDKIETRRALKDTLYSPFFREINGSGDIGIHEVEEKLPFILKEPMSSGSKGVTKINTYEEYEDKLDEINKRYPEEPILLEECLEGPQFLVETITIDNNVYIVAVIEQEISYACKFIVTGYKVILDHENEFIQSLIVAAKDIVRIIGMEKGPCHLELKYVSGQWKLIEANPRISGGAMNLLIETATGVNLVKETLKIALGQKPDLTCKYKQETFAQYVIAKREGILLKVTGRKKALNCEGVKHVYVKPRKGQLLIPPLSMGHRYAYVIATGDTTEDAMANAKYAAKQIQFFIKEIDSEMLVLFTQRQKDTLDEYYRNKPKFNEYLQFNSF